MLAQNTTLSTLHVSGNQIGDRGAQALLAADKARKNNYAKPKLAFLSVMTPTNDDTLDAQKKQSLLFQFRIGKNGNRLDENVLKNILSYNKPKPLRVTF